MPVRAICPNCQKRITAPDEFGGQARACPHCGAQMVLPAATPNMRPQKSESGSGGHEGGSSEPDPFNKPRKKADHHDLIDMTAMVDIVFFLLIYFLVTSFYKLNAAITAPTAEGVVGRTAKSSAERDPVAVQPLTVKIDSDDVIWVDQEPVMSSFDLVAKLRESKDQSGADGLRIAASPEATHGKMVMVLDAGVTAGFAKAQLALEDVQ